MIGRTATDSSNGYFELSWTAAVYDRTFFEPKPFVRS